MIKDVPPVVAQAYADILHHGIQMLDDAYNLQLSNWLQAELEHLHNIPSLLFESNLLRHRYYFTSERVHYLSQVQTIDSSHMHSRMKLFYVLNWKVISEFVDAAL